MLRPVATPLPAFQGQVFSLKPLAAPAGFAPSSGLWTAVTLLDQRKALFPLVLPPTGGFLFAHWTSIMETWDENSYSSQFFPFTGPVLCCHLAPSLLSSPQQLADVYRRSFPSFSVASSAAIFHMRTWLTRRLQAADLYFSHTKKGKITKGEGKCP